MPAWREVDDCQPTMPKHNRSILRGPKARIVRPAVSKSITHSNDEIVVSYRGESTDADNSAHDQLPVSFS